ncbi:MAG: VOC family protein [Gammaproteobacteria bacterium]
MQEMIGDLVRAYEAGRVSRRQLIQGLAAIAGAAAAVAAPPQVPSTFSGVSINHTALRVTNIARSRDFYQKHFGLPVIQQSESQCFLGLGPNFLALFRNQAAGLDHHCIAIEKFNAEAVVEELKRQGFSPRRPAGSDRVYFPDPDGLVVQVSAVDHRA